MSEELEQTGTDVSAESSPAPESDSSEQSAAPKADGEVEAAKEESKEVPFHEHPRFKELINQRNEFQRQTQEYERRLAELSTRLDSFNKPKEEPVDFKKSIEYLKGIDPNFARFQEALVERLEASERQRQALEMQQLQARASAEVERLHAEHKVPAEAKELYNAMLRQHDRPGLKVEDIPSIYKKVHENVSKYLDAYKRSTLTEYATAKKTDAKLPAAKKGASPKPSAPKFEYSKDKEEAKAQMVKNLMTKMRANSDI